MTETDGNQRSWRLCQPWSSSRFGILHCSSLASAGALRGEAEHSRLNTTMSILNNSQTDVPSNEVTALLASGASLFSLLNSATLADRRSAGGVW